MFDYTTDLQGLVGIAVQIVLPILVALVTKRQASSSLKAMVLLALTAVNQFGVAWLENFHHFDVKFYAMNIVVGFVISVANHFGLWKPTGVSEVAQRSGVQ